MKIKNILLKLEQTHKVCPMSETVENDWFWKKCCFNQQYFEHKGYKRKPKQFLMLQGAQLEAANKVIAFISCITTEPYKGQYTGTKEACALILPYIENIISNLFFDPLVSGEITGYTQGDKILKIADIILIDNFNYELSLDGALKWFNRNYPRTFKERNVTNCPIPDGQDEWPALRCYLYSMGSYAETRVWDRRD